MNFSGEKKNTIPLHGLLRQMGQPLDGAPSKQIRKKKLSPTRKNEVGRFFLRNKQAKKINVLQDGAVKFLSDLICAESTLLVEMCIPLRSIGFIPKPM